MDDGQNTPVANKPLWSIRAADAPALGLGSEQGEVVVRKEVVVEAEVKPTATAAVVKPRIGPSVRAIVRSPIEIALAMQLRPGLGVGADPAWMVRFLMSMFGWFAVLVSGQAEYY
ncbi:hypothetical protein BJ165DRAFT_1354933 [Panaeolus papilionaceus]|nr:hypothetical protein BJ165DRAFT_1354933 [Panaeolus papilionaceus]